MSLERLVFEGPQPVFSPYSYLIKLGVLGINVFVAWFEKKKAIELNNQLLQADSQHTMADIYVSLSVLASIFAIQMNWLWLDTLVAMVITVVIFKAGYEVILSNMGSLVDETILDADKIKTTVLSTSNVLGCHHIRSRGSENNVFIDLHIQVDPNLTIREGHQIAHRVEDNLRKEFGRIIAEVLIHVEEEGDDDILPPHEK